MANPGLTHEQLQEAVDLDVLYRTARECGERSKWPCTAPTFRHRVQRARQMGYTANVDDPAVNIDPIEDQLRDEIKTLRAALSQAQGDEITRRNVQAWLTRLNASAVEAEPPRWLVKSRRVKTLGVPTLLASDWHWGEKVRASEIHGWNEFDLDIANARARQMIRTTINLLKGEFANPNYPGIVFALGGDMVTGDIHEELSKTNDAPIMPTIVDLFGVLSWCIDTLAGEFGKVFVPCVTGNHGRNTRKPQAKERTATNFDWLIYSLLADRFHDDKRVTFQIPEGPDCQFRIYEHRYLLTHGDQFRGGDGLIGPLGPITRGRHKKASRNVTLNRGFDTMILGHFHTLMQLPHLIVNGSLKGYDEYAFANNFGFEVPAQALWLTHPRRGITHQMPIYLSEPSDVAETEWASWAA